MIGDDFLNIVNGLKKVHFIIHFYIQTKLSFQEISNLESYGVIHRVTSIGIDILGG